MMVQIKKIKRRMKMNLNIQNSTICDMIKLNNLAALIYLLNRSAVDLKKKIPGSKKSYMQLAIESGSDEVVKYFVHDLDFKNNDAMKQEKPFDYLLDAEEQFLSSEDSSKSKKIYQLLAVAGVLLNAGIRPKRKFLDKHNSPIARFLRSYNENVACNAV